MNLVMLLVVAVLTRSPQAFAAPGDLSGTVIERMDAGGYTYLLLKTASGEERWAAVPKSSAKKGETATVVGAMDMKNFESPTLKRKFDHIAFGMLGDASASAAPAKEESAQPHGGRAAATGPIKVAKAAGPDARTIGEVYAQKASLKGKEVVVSGKIVKYNAGILERNWAHLRDGSGKAKEGSDDLTVMLKDASGLGEVVTVRGKVALNKDLGGMYQFAVVLEDAVLVK